MIHLVIVPPFRAGRPTLAARSAADPARLYTDGLGSFARAGDVVRLTPVPSRLVLILAAHRACYVTKSELMDLLYADDPKGGPESMQIIDVFRAQNRFELDVLGVHIASRHERGLEITLVEPGTQNPVPMGLGSGGNNRLPIPAPWVDRAADLRRGGMSWDAICDAVAPQGHTVTIRKKTQEAHPDTKFIGRAVPPPHILSRRYLHRGPLDA